MGFGPLNSVFLGIFSIHLKVLKKRGNGVEMIVTKRKHKNRRKKGLVFISRKL
jgi:hypothetical protein